MIRNYAADERTEGPLDERELYGDPQHEEATADRSELISYGDPQHEVAGETASDVELARWAHSSGPESVERYPGRPSTATSGPEAGRERPRSAAPVRSDGYWPTRPTGRS
ncbi:hypothetical protein [Halomicrococcus sp. NG-SE-24]|uniref:hypothetical protein n=1 Tax=Halomicrococcus sp. NG-SE-24 TaxID=3436928 RepID=UPI003D97CA9E